MRMAGRRVPKTLRRRRFGAQKAWLGRRVTSLAALTAVAALVTYLFDPDRGRARRARLMDQVGGGFRRFGRRTRRFSTKVGAEAYGVKQKLAHLREEEKEYDDATLAHKVESELFRDAKIPKGQINISAEEGTIVIVGQVQTPELINELETRVRNIQGVQDVRNLLHLPDTPAPMK
jgi:hypothetical protein